MENILHIIHTDISGQDYVNHATARRKQNYLDQCANEGIPFKVIPGITGDPTPFKNVSAAHKKIVQYAKDNALEKVLIAEDDFIFTAPGAWKYFLDNMADAFDLYMGLIYAGETIDQRVMNGFSGGLTLYAVHSRFYDVFLNADTEDHIDRVLGRFCNMYEYRTPPKYCVKQLGGYSYNLLRPQEYSYYEDLIKQGVGFY